MKKGIALLSVAAAPFASAMKMDTPTVYGKVNKVIAYTDQEDIHSRKSMDGVTDVANSETRMGVKGAVKHEGHEIKYKVELGINSTYTDNNTTTERIRIRQAMVGMKSKVGTFKFGQTYTVLAKQVSKSDPLSSTVAGVNGTDQSIRIDQAKSDVGFDYRSRKDLVAYSTPSLHGLKYSVSFDRNDDNSNDVGTGAYGAGNWEHLLQFHRDFGGLDMEIYLGYHKWDESNKGDQSNMVYGANLGYGNFGFNFGLSQAEEENKTTPVVKEEIDRMFAGLTYSMKKNTFSFTYQTREDKNQGNVNGTNFDYTQMAFGINHKCTKHVSLNLTALKYEVENKTADVTGTAKTSTENDATLVALGMQVKF